LQHFLETVDRALEALTEWDRFAVNRQGHVTLVRPYPISVAFPESGSDNRVWKSSGEERATLCAELGLRLRSLESAWTAWITRRGFWSASAELRISGNFTLNIRSDFRLCKSARRAGRNSSLRAFLEEVSAEAERINARFQNGRWKPILLLRKHHSHKEIMRFYRAASVCLVTSLHDGMNLVAKEFIASREDERGALILSTFAGAALNLRTRCCKSL